MLGCVEVPFDRGLAGYSDGDALTHAICDAILGAAGRGDLGDAFPETPEWAGASGARLLGEVSRAIAPASVAYIDSTVICEAPRLSPERPRMRDAIAGALGIEPMRVSVKATTTDGMGFTGRGEGIAAIAVVTLEV